MKKILKFKKVLYVLNVHPLSAKKKYKIGIYFRFLKWQLTKHFYKNGMIVPWINNTKLILYPGRTSAVGNYYFGLFEYAPMAFLEIFGNEKFSKLLENLGFRLYLYNPQKRALLKGNAKDAGNNGIYIRDIKLAIRRVKQGEDIIYCGKSI